MEINIPTQQIFATSKGRLISEGGIITSEYKAQIVPEPTSEHVILTIFLGEYAPTSSKYEMFLVLSEKNIFMQSTKGQTT